MGRSLLVWVAGSLALAWLASWVPVFVFDVRVYGQDANLSFVYLFFGVGMVLGLIGSVALFFESFGGLTVHRRITKIRIFFPYCLNFAVGCFAVFCIYAALSYLGTLVSGVAWFEFNQRAMWSLGSVLAALQMLFLALKTFAMACIFGAIAYYLVSGLVGLGGFILRGGFRNEKSL